MAYIPCNYGSSGGTDIIDAQWVNTNLSTSIDLASYSGDITILLGGRQGLAIWWGNLDSQTVTKKYSTPSTDASTCTISSSKVVSTSHKLSSAPSTLYSHGTFVLKGHLSVPN